jgi:hypothetical protein
MKRSKCATLVLRRLFAQKKKTRQLFHHHHAGGRIITGIGSSAGLRLTRRCVGLPALGRHHHRRYPTKRIGGHPAALHRALPTIPHYGAANQRHQRAVSPLQLARCSAVAAVFDPLRASQSTRTIAPSSSPKTG